MRQSHTNHVQTWRERDKYIKEHHQELSSMVAGWEGESCFLLLLRQFPQPCSPPAQSTGCLLSLAPQLHRTIVTAFPPPRPIGFCLWAIIRGEQIGHVINSLREGLCDATFALNLLPPMSLHSDKHGLAVLAMLAEVSGDGRPIAKQRGSELLAKDSRCTV